MKYISSIRRLHSTKIYFYRRILPCLRKNLGASLLGSFIFICILLPLRCPSGMNYPYLKLSEIADDLITCPNNNFLNSELSKCPLMPDNLGTFSHVPKVINETLLAHMATKLKIQSGGYWHPSHCLSIQKVAIIIPYRNRKHHLQLFLQYMHPFLQSQYLHYGIFIIEQSQKHDFNRGKLFNIGFVEALKYFNSCCFIFHDVDLLPESPRHIYGCSSQPRHMCSAIDVFRYILPYKDILGGVVAFSKEQFIAVNGYSNIFFGWGGEDDDLSDRVKAKGFSITRWEPKLSRFTMLHHEKAIPNPKRFILLKYNQEKYNEDGINSLKYKVLKFEKKDLYTRILVDVNP